MTQYYDISLLCPVCGCSVIDSNGICMGYIMDKERIQACMHDRKDKLYLITR